MYYFISSENIKYTFTKEKVGGSDKLIKLATFINENQLYLDKK